MHFNVHFTQHNWKYIWQVDEWHDHRSMTDFLQNVLFSKKDNFSSFFKTKEFGGEDLVYCETCDEDGLASSVSLPLWREHILHW